MDRNFTFQALVLKQYPIAEAHRSVTFYTRERGLLNAIAHGAAKSQTKLKLLTSPFRHVILKAYHDPVKESWKVVDLEERNLFTGLAEDLDRFYTACLWVELVLKTSGSGEDDAIFDLVCQGLTLLENADSLRIQRLNLQVLWRFLEIAGLFPDFSSCESCGRPLVNVSMLFSPVTGELLCSSCSAGKGISLEPLAVDYLLSTAIHDLAESLEAPVGNDETAALIEISRRLLERALGMSLKAFHS